MNEQKVITLYTKKDKSTYEIADMMKTYPNKIRRVLKKHGISLKSKSEAQKNALKSGASSIPTEGKTRTMQEKLKISKSLKKTWDAMSDTEYQRRVEQAKKRWMDMSEEEKNYMRIVSQEAIRKSSKYGSKLERFIVDELIKAGFKIEHHKKDLFGSSMHGHSEVDIYVKSLKTIIEVDGPSHFIPIWGEERLQKQIKSDEQKSGLALSHGFAIIRIRHMDGHKKSMCLVDKENLKNSIVDILNQFKLKFPAKSKRYIEIEA